MGVHIKLQIIDVSRDNLLSSSTTLDVMMLPCLDMNNLPVTMCGHMQRVVLETLIVHYTHISWEAISKQ